MTFAYTLCYIATNLCYFISNLRYCVCFRRSQVKTGMSMLMHWFVLSRNVLKFFSDSLAEHNNLVNGVIDITNCLSVEEVKVTKNYGFIVKVSTICT